MAADATEQILLMFNPVATLEFLHIAAFCVRNPALFKQTHLYLTPKGRQTRNYRSQIKHLEEQRRRSTHGQDDHYLCMSITSWGLAAKRNFVVQSCLSGQPQSRGAHN